MSPQIGCAEGIPEPLRDFAERVARGTEHICRITGADIDTYLYECDLIFNEDERQKFAYNAKRYIENSGAFSEPLALCLDWALTDTLEELQQERKRRPTTNSRRRHNPRARPGRLIGPFSWALPGQCAGAGL